MKRHYQEDLNLKVQAGTPIIQIISYEWRRINGMAMVAAKALNKDLFRWNNAEGVRKYDPMDGVFVDEKPEMREPESVLEWFQGQDIVDTILLMEDLHIYFDATQWRSIIGRLRLSSRQKGNNNLILSQPVRNLPAELEKDVYILEIPLPDRDLMKTVIKDALKGLEIDESKRPDEDHDLLAEAALGLTDQEATYTFKEIALAKGRLTRDEIPEIVERKEQIIKKSGILEYFHPREGFGDVGGLENLKNWLKNRKAGFEQGALEFGMTPPKGVLLLGVQGCGKSLVAKAIASEWNLPLLKFDLGKVFQAHVGESEANIRRALDVAEAVSPSILWIDEIEKGLSGVGSSDKTDSGTTARVFGTMLTWMQDKNKPVFVIATANNIGQLPPELLRKGRFDEIFFVDLPGSREREDIWKIHLRKRLNDVRYEEAGFDINKLSKVSGGYSGAEIEEAINEALYTAYNDERELTTKDLVTSVAETYPLSKVMAENIMRLRQWAKVRTRLASDEEKEDIKPDKDVKKAVLRQERYNPFG